MYRLLQIPDGSIEAGIFSKHCQLVQHISPLVYPSGIQAGLLYGVAEVIVTDTKYTGNYQVSPVPIL